MGSSHSAEFLEMPLIAQDTLISGIDTRFCFPTNVKLFLKGKFVSLKGDGFEVQDPNTGAMVFDFTAHLVSVRDRKVLRDAQGVDIAHMREPLLTAKPQYVVSSDVLHEHELFRVRTNESTLRKSMWTEFTDPVTKTEWRLMIEGDWRALVTMVFLEPCTSPRKAVRTGTEIPVARITRPTVNGSVSLTKNNYYLEVAANVDLALMVLICAALDGCRRETP